jgi:hypothetical protein
MPTPILQSCLRLSAIFFTNARLSAVGRQRAAFGEQRPAATARALRKATAARRNAGV